MLLIILRKEANLLDPKWKTCNEDLQQNDPIAACQVWDMYEGLNMCNMSYYYSHVTALDSWVH